jgi:hypothetical protein
VGGLESPKVLLSFSHFALWQIQVKYSVESLYHYQFVAYIFFLRRCLQQKVKKFWRFSRIFTSCSESDGSGRAEASERSETREGAGADSATRAQPPKAASEAARPKTLLKNYQLSIINYQFNTMSNKLIAESSPYLLQHAHNPVDWYAWGDEAFARAKAENKPILVSIGYATCHWCHVMERESFEDATVAAFMNTHFINIKVDREERPDVDNIYMEVVQLVSGNGGWPLNCFILPDGRAFFAGTYFPPKNAYGRVSWSQVLSNIHTAFSQRRDEVEEQARVISGYLQKSTTNFVQPLGDFLANYAGNEAAVFPKNALESTFSQLSQGFDSNEGGFGGAPKFPATHALRFCLQYAKDGDKAEAALEHVHLSLEKMSLGGIYDHVGGGFARYATDSIWFAPHFEKMLYDNALLLGLLADAYLQSPNPLYAQTIAQTIVWLKREMLQKNGGYASAIDADSEGVEGKFYVWTQAEIQALLSPTLSDLATDFYGLKADGNWEHGQNIFAANHSPAAYAKEKGIALETLEKDLESIKNTLLLAREKRIRPILDDKILLDWNALLVVGLAKAAHALQNSDYKKLALDLLDFLSSTFAQADMQKLFHSSKIGHAPKIDAFLDDYAFYIDALLAGYSLSFELKYLHKAADMADFVLQEFWDESEHNFFFTAAEHSLVVRPKDLYDNATPSGNAVMIDVLQRLSALLSRPDYGQRAAQSLQRMRQSIEKYPQSFGRWATALWAQTMPMREIVVVGKNAHNLAAELQSHALENAVVVASRTGSEPLELLEGRAATSDETLIYVCIGSSCQRPVSTVAEAILR